MDTNEGSEEKTDVRSRLVAKDFKNKTDKNREDLFVGTPPLEAIRMHFSKAETRRKKGCQRKCSKMMFIGVKKAHLNPRCKEDVYIELPEEAGQGGGVCRS